MEAIIEPPNYKRTQADCKRTLLGGYADVRTLEALGPPESEVALVERQDLI